MKCFRSEKHARTDGFIMKSMFLQVFEKIEKIIMKQKKKRTRKLTFLEPLRTWGGQGSIVFAFLSFWCDASKQYLFDRLTMYEKSLEFGPGTPKCRFIAPGQRRMLHFWPGGPRGRLARGLVKKTMTGAVGTGSDTLEADVPANFSNN